MGFPRQFGPPVAAILLIAVSVFAAISFGEAKWFGARQVGDGLLKRDGPTLAFSLPWSAPAVAVDAPHALATTNAKLVSLLGGLLDAITIVAGNVLSEGTNLADNIIKDASGYIPDAAAEISDASEWELSSILNDASSAVNQDNQVLGMVVSDAASFVGGIVGAITNALPKTIIPAALTSQVLPLAKTIGSDLGNRPPLIDLPTSSVSAGLMFGLPVTQNAACQVVQQSGPTSSGLRVSAPFTSATPLVTAVPSILLPASLGTLPTPSISPFPIQQLPTVTVTETWHSTHYSVTATFYSFMSVLTIACNQAMSPCPAYNSNPNLSNGIVPLLQPSSVICPNGATVQDPKNSPAPQSETNPLLPATAPNSGHPCSGISLFCSECPDGYFCPHVQTLIQNCLCGLGWACAHCKSGWDCYPASTSALESSVSATPFTPTNAGPQLSSNSISVARSNSSSTPESTLPPSGPRPTGSVACPDGFSVFSLQNWGNGALSQLQPSPPLSSLPVNGQAGSGRTSLSQNISSINGIAAIFENLQSITKIISSVALPGTFSAPTGLNDGGFGAGSITLKPLSSDPLPTQSIANLIPTQAIGSLSLLPATSRAVGQSIPIFSLSVISNLNGAAGSHLSSALPITASAIQAKQCIPSAVGNLLSSILPIATGLPVAVQTGTGGTISGVGGLLTPTESAASGAVENVNESAGNLISPIQSADDGAFPGEQNFNIPAVSGIGVAGSVASLFQSLVNSASTNVPIVGNIDPSVPLGGGFGLKQRRRNAKRDVMVEVVTVKDVS